MIRAITCNSLYPVAVSSSESRETIMRLPNFRVRTLMIAVGLAALLIWVAMMAIRSYGYYRRATEFGAQERGWREIAARNDPPEWSQFHSDCVQYFTQLSAKYRHAMWRPWLPVAPDPHAPGYDQWLEQERRAKRVAPNLPPPSTPARGRAPGS
jgi:hypothetical protein